MLVRSAIRTYSVLLLLTLSFFAAQVPCASADEPANIHAGNVLTGVNGAISHNWYDGGYSNTILNLNVPIQYFVIDHLAVGGLVGLNALWQPNYAAQTNLSVGPAATYYFLLQEKLGYYVSEGVLFAHQANGSPNSYNDWSSQTQVGANYFVTPAVAFGPAIQYVHQFSSASASSADRLSLAFAFSIYL